MDVNTLQKALYAKYSNEEPWGEISYDEKPFFINDSTVSVAEDFGGEGMGDVMYLVLMVKNPDGTIQYFRKDGYYVSYDGGTWDGDFREVKPQQKTITVYETSIGEAAEEYDSYGDDEDSYL